MENFHSLSRMLINKKAMGAGVPPMASSINDYLYCGTRQASCNLSSQHHQFPIIIGITFIFLSSIDTNIFSQFLIISQEVFQQSFSKLR